MEARRGLRSSPQLAPKMTISHLQPPGVDLKTTLTRAKFESLNAASFESCLETVKAVRSPPTSVCSPADLSLIAA